MAKKTTINGSGFLENLNQDWGGVNETQSAETHYGTPVPAGNEWGVNRGEVERFIKAQLAQFGSRIGYFKVVAGENPTDNILAGFASEDDYDAWFELSDENKWGETGLALIVSYVTLPSAEGSDTYSVTIALEERPSEVQPSTDVKISVKGTYTVYYAAGGQDAIDEQLRFVIQVRTNNVWRNVGEVRHASNTDFFEIDLSEYLVTGENDIRIRANNDDYEYHSVWASLHFNVVNLSIVPVMNPQLPITGDSLILTYLIGGSADKYVEFQFGTGTGRYFHADFPNENTTYNTAYFKHHMGTRTETSVGEPFQFADATLLNGTNGILLDGLHTVRARVWVSDAVKTDWVESQYMVARTENAPKMVVLNNVSEFLENWTEVKFFDWAAFTGSDASMQVHFRLTPIDNPNEEYMTWSFNAQNNSLYSFTAQVGIEIQDATVTVFSAYMRIEDDEGNNLAEPVLYTFTNLASNQPTAGADLVINPSTRNNTEENPRTVINSVNGMEVTRGSGQNIERSVFTGFSFVTDGWMEVTREIGGNANDRIRALRVPANRSLVIPYNPFMYFTSGDSRGRSMTFEIDFRTMNISDDTQRVLRIGTAITGGVWGFEMLPTEAYLLTDNTRALDDQNVTWAEDTRTRLTINVLDNYGQTGLNLVRIFLNGIIEREFFYNNYNTGDRFTATSGVGIEIGGTTADIDIFSIRCYQQALSTQAVMQDYKSTLGTAVEKVYFNTKNDIKNGSGLIGYEEAKAKGYNVIGHIGHLPHYGDDNKGKTERVTIEIHINGDPMHSGTLTNLTATGQGTTAMTYRDWNQQYKINKGTDKQGNPYNSVFTDELGNVSEDGAGYVLQDGEPAAKKLVGKINFASCMQSHKIGLTKIYNDLYKHLMKNGTISTPAQMAEGNYPNARIAVFEKPFLFFHKESENDENWTFKYLMTFGAGKGDKPTFGFKDSKTGNMLMVEGANNDRPLALFQIPWNDDVYYVTEKQDALNGESWWYNGTPQINFGIGETEEDDAVGEYPSNTAAINAMKAFFNFAYLHNTRIKPFIGTLTQLRASATADKETMYWVTQAETGSAQYNLYRWDALYNNGQGRWDNAGVDRTLGGGLEVLNMRTQYEAFCTDISASQENFVDQMWNETNEKIVNMRRAHFRARANTVLHVDDALYHSCFVKFYAGTDNRAKNTYYYTDPDDLKIRFMQDDLDTMLKTNNVGQNRKPYYVEEHDVLHTEPMLEYYWQGESSGFYNLLEEAFEAEMTTMMYNMMAGMASMANEGRGGTVMEFQEQYLLVTQDYFPAIAYNEQARLVYEAAAVSQMSSEEGHYTNTVPAITQSVGSQRWSEYQWLKDRIMYISSWCEYGEFGGQGSGGLSWRGTTGSYTFTLTPAKWLYPRVGGDRSNEPASPSGRVRVPANTPFTYQTITRTSDATIVIRGIDYFFEIGDMNVPLSSNQQFAFMGRKLRKITVNPNGSDANVLLANQVRVTAPNITEFVFRKVSTIQGAIDLSQCPRLEKIDIRGTSCSGLQSSDNTALTELYLPATLTSLSLVSPSRITTLNDDANIEGLGLLTSLSISGESGNVGQKLITRCYNDGANLTDLTLEGEDWTNPDLAMVNYVSHIPNKNIKVTIHIVNQNFTFSLKQALMAAFGDIDDQTNDVWVEYTPVALTGLSLSGVEYMASLNFDYKLDVIPDPLEGNDFKSAVWSLDNNVNATIDPNTGIINVIQVGTQAGGEQGTVTLTVTKLNNQVITASKLIHFWQRTLMVGDYVFSDGSYSPSINGGGGRTAIGRCFYINPNNPLDRRMVSMGAIRSATEWGYRGNGITLSNGTIFYSTVPSVTINGGNGNDAQAFTIAPIDSLSENKPLGMSNTLAIISYRNILLNDSNINLPIPEQQATQNGRSVWENLLEDMTQAAMNNIKQYYYPAASLCYAYEPSVGQDESLDAKFRAGKWYLPLMTELEQICTYIFDTLTSQRPWSCIQNNWNAGANNANWAHAYNNVNRASNGRQEKNAASYSVYACCQF